MQLYHDLQYAIKHTEDLIQSNHYDIRFHFNTTKQQCNLFLLFNTIYYGAVRCVDINIHLQ
jgi:hypothetical protein